MQLVRTVERQSKSQSLPTLSTPALREQLMSILDRKFLSYGKLLDRAREDANKDIKHRQRDIDRDFATINRDTIHLSVLYHVVKHDLDKEQRQKYEEEWLNAAQKIEELSKITDTEIQTLDLEEHGANALRQAYRESKTRHDYRRHVTVLLENEDEEYNKLLSLLERHGIEPRSLHDSVEEILTPLER
jgi:hypothetical protein